MNDSSARPATESRRFFAGALSRLRVRLLLLVLMAMLPVLGLVFYTGMEQREAAIAEARASALRIVRMATTGQKQHIEAARQLLTTLAQLGEIRQTNVSAAEGLFRNLLNLHPVYANFGIISPDGYLIASGGPIRRRVFLGDHFVGCCDEMRQPVPVAPLRHALQVRSYTVALPNGVAGCTARLEQIPAFIRGVL